MLLQLKHEGRVGGGLWNGPGGKIDDGESPEAAVLREVREETGLELERVDHHGTLTFFFGNADEPVYTVDVFTSDSFAGELCDSEEGILKWHPEDSIPYESMWADDEMWLPHVLDGKRISGTFRLSEDLSRIIEHDLRVLDTRPLNRDEIGRVWEIDRREFVENVYRVRGGTLALEPLNFDIQGWAPGQREEDTPRLLACHDRGGAAWGAFEDGVIVGAAVLESKFIGARSDTLQLKFLHVGRDNRGQGLGAALFDRAVHRTRESGAKRLYISATPSERSVDFYLLRGCVLAMEIEPDLFALEPEDIHLEYLIS